jgi:AcrR family transcriptional regulator
MQNSPNTKKQRLLSAAHILFLAEGYNGVKVEEICTAANTAKGTFFYYFPTKQAIVFDLLDQQLHALSRTTYDQLMSLPNNGLVRLNYFVEYMLSPMALTPESIKYFNMYRLPSWFESNICLLRNKYFYPIFHELIRSGKQESLFHITNSNVSSEILYMGIERYIHDHRNRLDDIVSLRQTMYAIQEVLEKSLCLTEGALALTC